MTIPETFLKLLACPMSGEKLVVANSAILMRLNEAIKENQLHDADGNRISYPLEAALVTTTGDHIYPVIAGVPHLLPSARIRLD